MAKKFATLGMAGALAAGLLVTGLAAAPVSASAAVTAPATSAPSGARPLPPNTIPLAMTVQGMKSTSGHLYNCSYYGYLNPYQPAGTATGTCIAIKTNQPTREAVNFTDGVLMTNAFNSDVTFVQMTRGPGPYFKPGRLETSAQSVWSNLYTGTINDGAVTVMLGQPQAD